MILKLLWNIVEYSNDMSDVYKNIEDYNQDSKIKVLIKVLIVFDDMIADMINNKKLNPIYLAETEKLIFQLPFYTILF